MHGAIEFARVAASIHNASLRAQSAHFRGARNAVCRTRNPARARNATRGYDAQLSPPSKVATPNHRRKHPRRRRFHTVARRYGGNPRDQSPVPHEAAARDAGLRRGRVGGQEVGVRPPRRAAIHPLYVQEVAIGIAVEHRQGGRLHHVAVVGGGAVAGDAVGQAR